MRKTWTTVRGTIRFNRPDQNGVNIRQSKLMACNKSKLSDLGPPWQDKKREKKELKNYDKKENDFHEKEYSLYTWARPTLPYPTHLFVI